MFFSNSSDNSFSILSLFSSYLFTRTILDSQSIFLENSFIKYFLFSILESLKSTIIKPEKYFSLLFRRLLRVSFLEKFISFAIIVL